jgi:hypothetical protein
MGNLDEARRELRKAFAGYKLPEAISYCTYCDDDAYERALHAPLDELPPKLVDKYVADAFHHTGGRAEFLHFLPRVLDAFAADAFVLASAPVLARCFERATPATWREHERAAVAGFLAAAFADAVERGARPDFTGWADVASGFVDLLDAVPKTPAGAGYLAGLFIYEAHFANRHDVRAAIARGVPRAVFDAGYEGLPPDGRLDVDLARDLLGA